MNKPELEKILFLDIETVPTEYQYSLLDETTKTLWNRKWLYDPTIDPETQYAKAGIYAEFAKVICIGLGYYSRGSFYATTFAGDNEYTLLRQLSELLNRSFATDQHLLCAHNGKEFDFPFLCRRLVVNGITLPKPLQIQGKKPWEVKHLDTMEMWKFGDYKNFSSLDLLAHIFGIPSPKDDMNGSMVAKTFYEDSDLERIEKYCLKDVITLARVYNRFANHSYLKDEEIIFV